MTEIHKKLLDFILPILSDKYPKGEHLSKLVRLFTQKFNVEITNEERVYFNDLYEFKYFVRHGNAGVVIITPETKEVIDKYGLLSNYNEENRVHIFNEIDTQNEFKKLQIENLQLQNESIKYQNSLREKQTEIDDLTKMNLKLQNRHLKRFIFYSIISFVFGIIASNYKAIFNALKDLF